MLTPGIIRNLIKDDAPKHTFYNSSVKKAEELLVHAEREYYPKKLLDVARPNEEPKFKKYREAVYEAQTFKAFGKITTLFAKTEKAEDYAVNFPESFPVIPERETLEYYTKEAFPFYDNIATWLWQYALEVKARDPNLVIAILPLPKESLMDTEFVRPYPFIFESRQVMQFIDNELAVLLDEEKSTMVGGGDGNIFHVLDRDSYAKCVQIDVNSYEIEVTPFTYGYMPAIRPGSYKVHKQKGNGVKLYDSELSVCLPDFNEAERRYSDHQVNMVRHIHPKEWRYVTADCPTCNGEGVLKNRTYKGLEDITCKRCSGQGQISYESPFGQIQVPMAKKIGVDGQATMSGAPGGYLEVPTESINAIQEEFERCLFAAYSAMNMEFLQKVPIGQSGIAKEWDRKETDNTIYNFARHFIRQLVKPVYEFIAAWRYQYILTKQQIEEILPVISIPRKFDVVHSAILLEKAKLAKDAGVSPAISRQLELSYVQREFGEDSYEYKKMKACINLDPLPNKSTEDIGLMIADGRCTELDAKISANIDWLVNRAVEEKEGFLDIKLMDQRKILVGYINQMMPTQDLTMGQGIPERTDVQAEAQANLRGSVGGVQGLLGIQASVASGATTYESGVATLMLLYGYEEQDAKKLLGNPAKPTVDANVQTTKDTLQTG